MSKHIYFLNNNNIGHFVLIVKQRTYYGGSETRINYSHEIRNLETVTIYFIESDNIQ